MTSSIWPSIGSGQHPETLRQVEQDPSSPFFLDQAPRFIQRVPLIVSRDSQPLRSRTHVHVIVFMTNRSVHRASALKQGVSCEGGPQGGRGGGSEAETLSRTIVPAASAPACQAARNGPTPALSSAPTFASFPKACARSFVLSFSYLVKSSADMTRCKSCSARAMRTAASSVLGVERPNPCPRSGTRLILWVGPKSSLLHANSGGGGFDV